MYARHSHQFSTVYAVEKGATEVTQMIKAGCGNGVDLISERTFCKITEHDLTVVDCLR